MRDGSTGRIGDYHLTEAFLQRDHHPSVTPRHIIPRKPISSQANTTSAVVLLQSSLPATSAEDSGQNASFTQDIAQDSHALLLENPGSETEPKVEQHAVRDVRNDLRHPVVTAYPRSFAKRLNWQPSTLKWPFMLFLILISLGLSATVGLLTYYSVKNTGLVDDSSSVALLFGWRFCPTLIAVIYVLMQTALVVDLRRTEVFARLSRNRVSPASTTILHGVDSWWNDPWEALRQQPDGNWRGWALFWASVANITGILVISPLSAGLLSTQDLPVAVPANLSRIAPFPPLHLNESVDDATFFRTIAASTLKLSTSAWVNTQYATLPFWPSNFSDIPLSSVLAPTVQVWKAKTTVFQMVMDCHPMWLTEAGYQPSHSISPPPYRPISNASVISYYSLQLTSDDGCVYEFAIGSDLLGIPMLTLGGGWWSKTSGHNYVQDPVYQGPTIVVAQSTECRDRDVFFTTTPFLNESTRANGHVCASSYYQSEIDVTASTSTSGSSVSFDKRNFDKNKKPMSAVLDVKSFERQFLSTQWASKIRATASDLPVIGGPLVPIGAMNNFSVEQLMRNLGVVDQAKALKQQFLGEMLQRTFQSTGDKYLEVVQGQQILVNSRIAVQFAIGITLASLLFFSGVMYVSVFYFSRPDRRPLGISRDPASLGAVATLITDRNARSYFEGTERSADSYLRATLRKEVCRLDGGLLSILGSSEVSHVPKGRHQHTESFNWKPPVLRSVSGICGSVFLIALAVGITVLFVESSRDALYRSFFVYQKTFSLGQGATVNFAPYAILPTLFAVLVKLWWGALESVFKRLQPFVSLALQPTKTSEGITLSYMDPIMLWTSWKAAGNKHWTLTSICVGVFLTEIFTVGMSALWVRDTSILERTLQIHRSLELRTVPSIFNLSSSTIDWARESQRDITKQINIEIYGNALNSWLYGGIVDLAFNGSRPPWTSKDLWTFAPADLSMASIHGVHVLDAGTDSITTTPDGLNSNVTFISPGLRARLDCTPIDLSNTTDWLVPLDFTNSSRWNISTTPPGLSTGYSLSLTGDFNVKHNQDKNKTSFFTDASQLHCCANMSQENPGIAAIGYWSTNGYSSAPIANFTVKWILGEAFEQIAKRIDNVANYEPGYNGYFVWRQPPKMTALNCVAVVESAVANVTLDPTTKLVEEYNITTGPSNYSAAWSDPFHNYMTFYHNNPATPFFNVTVSHGWLFQEALLTAADHVGIKNLNYYESYYEKVERLDDRTYNFRQPGLNADFMSYSSLSLVENNVQALLDPDILYQVSNKVFGTFFQHFIINNVSLENGSYGFQPVNTTKLWNQDPSVNPNASVPATPQSTNPVSHLDGMVDVIVRVRVQQLHMSPTTTYLCLSILAYLIATTIWVFTRHRKHFEALPRDMDSLASILALIYASPKLLSWIEEHKHEKDWGLKRNRGNEPMAMLGPFDGGKWGVELLDEDEVEMVEERIQPKKGARRVSKSGQAHETEGLTEVVTPMSPRNSA